MWRLWFAIQINSAEDLRIVVLFNINLFWCRRNPLPSVGTVKRAKIEEEKLTSSSEEDDDESSDDDSDDDVDLEDSSDSADDESEDSEGWLLKLR